jgi:hypothetical protein
VTRFEFRHSLCTNVGSNARDKASINLMIFLFTVVGMSVHMIFMFKREILFNRKTFKILLLTSLLPFGLFYLIRELTIPTKGLEMLLVPFLALIVFWVMASIYRGIFGKDAKDTYHSMDLKLMKDGIFNFLFWVVGLMLPILLAYKVLN